MQNLKNLKGAKRRVTDKQVTDQVRRAVGIRRRKKTTGPAGMQTGPRDGSGPNQNCVKKK